jgi:hypothetical protein
MGIFSRIFQRGQDGGPSDGREEAHDSEGREARADGTPEETEIEDERTEPVTASSPALAAAAAGAAPSPFSTPLWSWPQRTSDPHARRESSAAEDASPAPHTSAAREETPMAKPDDPGPPTSRPRAPLPGLPKRTTPPPAAAAAPPEAAAPPRDKNDATVVMSPPPPAAAQKAQAPRSAPASRAAPPAPAPAPAPAAPPPRRGHPDTLTSVLDEVVMELQGATGLAPAPAPAPVKPPAEHGVSTPEDLAAVRSVFNDVAVAHVAQVRDVMLELSYGDADPKWIEMTKPALRSLRAMAAQMELVDLCEALDAFCGAVDAAIANRARVTEEDKAELMRRYARLVELIPQAFELDAERDRREPIIVEALLYQVPGVEQPTIEKLFAVGLGRLDALMSANAGDVAAVSGLRLELATAIVEQFRSYRAGTGAAVSAPEPAVEHRRLGELLITLSLQNDDFTRASADWSDEAQLRKRQLRKQREQTFQQIKVALARLGEREQLQRLEKLPFQDRIAMLDRYLSSQQHARPSP